MTDDLRIRPVTPGDIDLVCAQREQIFLEADRAPDLVASMREGSRAWLSQAFATGSYRGFVADVGDVPAGGVGMLVMHWPPHPLHPLQATRGYVLNLYVDAAFRGRGIARLLMSRAEQGFRERGVQHVVLHATAAGRPLYERMGWSATNEMAKRTA